MKNQPKRHISKQKINILISMWCSFWIMDTVNDVVGCCRNLNTAVSYFTKGRTSDIDQISINEYDLMLSSFNDMVADPNTLKNFLYEADIPFIRNTEGYRKTKENKY